IETSGSVKSESVGGVSILDHRVLFATTIDAYTDRARARILLASTAKAPVILAHPQDQILWIGQPLRLSVSATGTSPIDYQWYRGEAGDTSTPIAGATSAIFNLPTANTTATYWVRTSSLDEFMDSESAQVLVASEPFIQSRRDREGRVSLRLIAEPGSSWRLMRSQNTRDWVEEPGVITLDTAVADVLGIEAQSGIEFFQCVRQP
ncbi:MAG: immunoglobulin domain-containing protein, partial [Verrucomicrobiae bacterium]|nr:immunoglobulin domain-containing protein [Verrucomicrobiae bacterium]